MRVAVWVLLGWLGIVTGSALAARLPPLVLLPDVPLGIVAFLGTRRSARNAALVAFALGYLVDVLASAPLGLHQVALVATALGVWLVGEHVGGTGAVHAALVTGFAQLAYHLTLLALLCWQGRPVGFASWSAALLLPQAVLTGGVAWLAHGHLLALHRRLAPRLQQGLQWR